MLAIAVLAGLFAAFGVFGAVAIVIVIGVILLPILLAGPGHRLRAMVWVSSIYPFLILSSFYATWLTAWCVLGHPPRPYTDDPHRLGPSVHVIRSMTGSLIMAGVPLIWFVHAPLTLAILYWNMAQRKTPVGKGIMQLLIPPLAWLSAYAVLKWDPGHVGTWFID
jgi:hypothetical protein